MDTNTLQILDYFRVRNQVASYCKSEEAKVELENVINGVEVKWTKVKGATEYRIYRKKFGEKDGVRVGVVKDSNTFVDTNVENGTRYCYYVVIQLENAKATTNVAAVMYLEAPQIDKLWNN